MHPYDSMKERINCAPSCCRPRFDGRTRIKRALSPPPSLPSFRPRSVGPSEAPIICRLLRPSVRPSRRRRRQRPNIRRWRAKFAFQKVSSSLGRQEAHTHLRRPTPIETEGGGIRLGSKCIPLKIFKMDPADGNVAHNPHHAVPEVNIGMDEIMSILHTHA